MIRGAILGAALVASGATTAMAETVFVGTIKFTAVTAQCQNVRLHEYARSTFHPAVRGGNQNFAGLSWVWTNYARGHKLNGANFDATFRTVVTGGTGWGDPYTVAAAQQAQIRITSYAPALGTITAATPTLTIVGQIRRLGNDPGGLACVATFLGTYVKDSFQ